VANLPVGGKDMRLGLVGLGSVGRAFAALLVSEGARVQRDHGVDLRVTGLVTARYGSVASADGIDLSAALQRARSGRSHGEPTAATDFAASCPADAIIETLPLEP
jgi:homoserine dehydrogenase